MSFYKGYIEVKGKKPVEPFKGRSDLKTLEQVRHLDGYAGVLADDAVLIDVDDAGHADILMDMVEALQLDCRVLQTSRGRHFLFKNAGDFEKCGTHLRLACGLTADIKVGSHASYEVLKSDGAERFVEWDSDEYQTAPKWLLPVKGGADFAGMEPGDGRNQSLFNHILTLTAAGFSKDEARECIRLVNSYVLAEPLGADELDTVLRDEAFPEDVFYSGKSFMHDRFAVFMVANEKIKRINGQLHIYKDGQYIAGYRAIETAMVAHIPTLKAQQRLEAIKYIELLCAENTPIANAHLIGFKNGVLDISTGELWPVGPDDVLTNVIPWDYAPGAYSEIADKTLDRMACGDPEIRALLEECIGYCFYRQNELSKAFMLTGDKSNGKSTFLDMVKRVLGQGNYSALDLSEMDEKFSISLMAGKLANVGDDISDEFLSGRAVAIFKKVVSGNEVKGEQKGLEPFFFNPYIKLLFSANDVPRIKDKTGAVLRRLVIVPFRATFSKDDPDFDPYITLKLRGPEVMRYLVRLGVEGLRRVIENHGFTESRRVTAELKEYEMVNNPVLLFLQDCEEHEILHQPTKDVHRRYSVFCAENGFGQMSAISFTKAVTKRLGYTTKRMRVNGRLESVYERSVE